MRCAHTLVLTLSLVAAGFACPLQANEVTQLAPFAVSADRAPRSAETITATGRWIAGGSLAEASAPDQALKIDPAFSLFRRASSLAANPTAQGVSLRGIGPSGASRTLVLLDGVPLNDPFGGWIAWTQVPSLALAGAELRPGGGSAAWGNAALGGTIALQSKPLTSRTNELQLEAGEFSTYRASLGANTRVGTTALGVEARAFATDGYHPLQASDRGAVDRPLESDHRLLHAEAVSTLGDIQSALTLRHFEEDRNNGTVLQRNATELDFISLALRGRTSAFDWRSVVYHQSQTFRSFFSGVAANRATETPANDQFDVPADAFGWSTTVAGEWSETQVTAGLDYREVRGETREDFLFSNGSFTRRRFAGGRQSFAGAFVSAERPLLENLVGKAQLRVDRWRNFSGHRREVDRVTGNLTRDERFVNRADNETSGTLEVRWTASPTWTLHTSAYTAFRVPTLNELYRPFRVGNVNTEANPALSLERLHGIEGGFLHRSGDLSWGLTAFATELRDAVGNVTLSSSPSLVSRQRLNLSRLRIRGVEGRAGWTISRELELQTAFLHSDARVSAAAVQPSLVGRRLAQVPRLTVTAGAQWRPLPTLRLAAQGRWSSSQFEDDENQLPLASAGTVDLSLRKEIGHNTSLALVAENVLDRAVPTARAAGGPTSYASPRAVRASLSVSF